MKPITPNIFLLLMMAVAILIGPLDVGAQDHPSRPAALDHQALALDPANRSDDFDKIFEQLEDHFTPELAQELKKVKIIFVPGFLADLYRLAGKENFSRHRQFLVDELGLQEKVDFELAPVNTFEGSNHNALTLSKLISQSDKKVILVGHSKGGLDILRALVNHPELQKKVAGILTLQTPYYGSPLADYLDQHFLFGNFFNIFLRVLQGGRQSLQDLTEREAKIFHQKHANMINKIIKEIPFLAFGSWFCPQDQARMACTSEGIFSTILLPFRHMLNRMGMDNDGLVPASHQWPTGSDFVLRHGMDHLSAVMCSSYSVDQIMLFKALLVVLLRQDRTPSR